MSYFENRHVEDCSVMGLVFHRVSVQVNFQEFAAKNSTENITDYRFLVWLHTANFLSHVGRAKLGDCRKLSFISLSLLY